MPVVLYTDSTEVGGAEVSLRNLAGALDDDLDVAILGVDRQVVDFVAAARPGVVSALVRRPSRSLDAPALAAHARAIRALRPAILHCNLQSPWSGQYAVAGSVAAPSTRVVAAYHLPVPPANEQQRLLKRLTSARVAAHVAVGARTAREVEALIPLPAGSVRTIHNGIPVDAPPPRRDARRPGGIVGAVGRIESQKGLDVLIHALAAVPDATLKIVGGGGSRADLEQLASRLGVAERVVWTGWTADPRSELADLDVFVQPSRFEAFPLAILEAMLAELPVVATDVGSVAEAVVTGVTGILVPPGDPDALARAIAELLADPGARERLGRQGRARVLEHFTADAMAASYAALYRELAA